MPSIKMLRWGRCRRGVCPSKLADGREGNYVIHQLDSIQTGRRTEVVWQVYFLGAAIGRAQERLCDAKVEAAQHHWRRTCNA